MRGKSLRRRFDGGTDQGCAPVHSPATIQLTLRRAITSMRWTGRVQRVGPSRLRTTRSGVNIRETLAIRLHRHRCRVPALAADVSASIGISQPGFYGQINIGDFPRPPVIYAQPVWVAASGEGGIRAADLPARATGPREALEQALRQYGACGRPVYFVREDWYQTEYVPRYQNRESITLAARAMITIRSTDMARARARATAMRMAMIDRYGRDGKKLDQCPSGRHAGFTGEPSPSSTAG